MWPKCPLHAISVAKHLEVTVAVQEAPRRPHLCASSTKNDETDDTDVNTDYTDVTDVTDLAEFYHI